jgi:hypothetical protein
VEPSLGEMSSLVTRLSVLTLISSHKAGQSSAGVVDGLIVEGRSRNFNFEHATRSPASNIIFSLSCQKII